MHIFINEDIELLNPYGKTSMFTWSDRENDIGLDEFCLCGQSNYIKNRCIYEVSPMRSFAWKM